MEAVKVVSKSAESATPDEVVVKYVAQDGKPLKQVMKPGYSLPMWVVEGDESTEIDEPAVVKVCNP